MTQDELKFIARVIYSEAGPGCSFEDRSIVSLTLLCRARHPGFKVKTMFEAASQPGAYSCVGDAKNSNWRESETFQLIDESAYLTRHDAWSNACFWTAIRLEMFKTTLFSHCCLGEMVVYYHDRSIAKPKSWDNKYFQAIKRGETDHFTYYAAV